MYDGREVANYVLDYADEVGINVTNLELQKITYFCHVWYLINTNKPLIKHNFEAWEYGPVLPYLYRSFKSFENRGITCRATKLDFETGNHIIAKLDIESKEKSLLRSIVSFYSQRSPAQLVDLSHIEGGPWYSVWYHEKKVNPGMQINNEDIINFYTSKDKPFSLE